MTVGVKVVQFTVGDASITFDMQDFTPKAVLFFGGFADTNGGSRFFGAADGTDQWSSAIYTRANTVSRATPSTGRSALSGRTDRCINILRVTGSGPYTVDLDTSAHVTSFAANTINLSWNTTGVAAGTKLTAVVFYGDMFEAKAGVSNVSVAGVKTTTTWQPGAVLMSTLFFNSASYSFGTADPTQDSHIFNGITFGWATFPEPPFQVQGTHSAGTTNSTRFGQQQGLYHNVNPLGLGNVTGFFDQNTPSPTGSNNTLVTQQSDGFTVISGSSLTSVVGYLAINWTAGRFMSGYMTPTPASVGESFTRWGGTYNSGGTDTDPSNHAQPSFMLLQGFVGGTSSYTGTNSHSWTVAAMDITTASGVACSGYPDGGPTIPLPTVATEYSTAFLNKFVIQDNLNATWVQMALTSFDDDGITVTYPVVPPAGTHLWPYFIMGQDTGTLRNGAYLTATEDRDTCAVDVLATIVGVNFQQNPPLTEPRDTCSMAISATLRATLAATEPLDTCVVYMAGTNNNPAYVPGDVNYVPPETKVFVVNKDLPFVILPELGFHVDYEERLFVVPAEIKTVTAPPVETGPWV